MSTPLPGGRPGASTTAAAARAIQGVILERLAVGMVVIALALLVYGAVEGRGPARAVAVVVGVLGIAAPLAGWRLHWSDAVTWLVLLPLMVAILASFAWVSAG